MGENEELHTTHVMYLFFLHLQQDDIFVEIMLALVVMYLSMELHYHDREVLH